MITEKLKNEFLDAVVNDQLKALTLLKEMPNLKDGHYNLKETALHFLAVEGYSEAVEFLSKNGFDPNVRNSVNTTPLEDVIRLKNYSVIKILLESGADPNASSETSDWILGVAISTGDTKIVKLLIDYGVNLKVCEDQLFLEFNLPDKPKKRDAILEFLNSNGIVYNEG